MQNKLFKEIFTKQELAKKLETNSKYLSQYIKHKYSMQYSDFISNLRIEYVLNELRDNNDYSNYTIDYIASDAGFGSRKTFSKAFYELTGLKPSYYIRQLKTDNLVEIKNTILSYQEN